MTSLDEFFAAARDAFIDCRRSRRHRGGGGLDQRKGPAACTPLVPPLGQRIAVADDAAFAFAYPFHLEAWAAARGRDPALLALGR